MVARLDADGSEIRLDGLYYIEALRRAHLALRPRSYLEVGSLFGDTLKLARCPTVAVDPAFQLAEDVLALNPGARLFKQTSDAFFAAENPIRLLGRAVDLAFLDGMHEFAFLLRDFIACERSCRRGSVVILHDCLPGDAFMARPHARVMESGPTNFPGWWTGDVWKMLPVLRAHRPDLKITCLDAQPTGLVAITGLNRRSTLLQARYADLVAEWEAVELGAFGMARLLAEGRPQSTEDWLATLRPFSTADRVSRQAALARLRLGAAVRSGAKRARARSDRAADPRHAQR